MPDSKWDVTKTGNGERGKWKIVTKERIGREVTDMNRVEARLFSIACLIYSFPAGREVAFHGIQRAGGNFPSARRMPWKEASVTGEIFSSLQAITKEITAIKSCEIAGGKNVYELIHSL